MSVLTLIADELYLDRYRFEKPLWSSVFTITISKLQIQMSLIKTEKNTNQINTKNILNTKHINLSNKKHINNTKRINK